MNKIILTIGAVVVTGGLVAASLKFMEANKEEVLTGQLKKPVGISLDYNDEGLAVETGDKKLSMVDVSFDLNKETANSFEVNKEIFNSELLNQAAAEGKWRIVLGIMKSTAQLPSGRVVIGKFDGVENGQILVDKGKITVTADDEGGPREIDINPGNIEKL